jgi:D-3-phosphoglycerate dehydrogenase
VERISLQQPLSENKLIAALNDATVAIISGELLSRRIFAGLPKLQLLCCDGVGVDHVDLQAATENGVVVTNAPVVHEANADLVIGLVIALMRKLLVADRAVRNGDWNQRSDFVGHDVHGRTLGLLGFGRVARCVAKRAAGFDFRLLAYSPNADRAVARELGVTIVSFDELLAESDILSIHVPLNEQTRALLGHEQFERMKSGAYLINTSRGALIDEQALLVALQSGRVAGAALDVLCNEPPRLDHPLTALDNVLLTPHVGSDTSESFALVFECIVNDILLFLNGRTPLHVVNPDALHSATRCQRGLDAH